MNKIPLWITVIAVVAIIFIPTIYKVITDNHRKLYLVVEKLVTEKAEDCIYDKKCNGDKVTLKQLYDNGYLTDELVNPVTKSVYSTESYIVINKKESKFYPA